MTTTEARRCLTRYTGSAGADYEAVQVPWDIVAVITDVSDTPEGGAAIRESLMGAGAPGWVRDAEDGWTDEHGWGLIGPRVTADEAVDRVVRDADSE